MFFNCPVLQRQPLLKNFLTIFYYLFIVSFFLQIMNFDKAMTRRTASVSQKSEIPVLLQ